MAALPARPDYAPTLIYLLAFLSNYPFCPLSIRSCSRLARCFVWGGECLLHCCCCVPFPGLMKSRVPVVHYPTQSATSLLGSYEGAASVIKSLTIRTFKMMPSYLVYFTLVGVEAGSQLSLQVRSASAMPGWFGWDIMVDSFSVSTTREAPPFSVPSACRALLLGQYDAHSLGPPRTQNWPSVFFPQSSRCPSHVRR